MGPDDGIGPQILARLAHGAGSIGQVDAVEAQFLDQTDMTLDHQRHVALMRNEAQGIGGTGDFIGVSGGMGEAQAGDVMGVQHAGKRGAKAFGVEGGRADQVDPGRVAWVVTHLSLVLGQCHRA